MFSLLFKIMVAASMRDFVWKSLGSGKQSFFLLDPAFFLFYTPKFKAMSYQKNAWETKDFPQITKIRLNEEPVMMEFNPYEKGTMGGGFNPIILEFSDSPPFLEKDSPKKFHITRREIEVLQWLQQGKSSWEISKILGLSERTVNFHIYNVMEKIKAVNRLHMVTIALRLGLIDLK